MAGAEPGTRAGKEKAKTPLTILCEGRMNSTLHNEIQKAKDAKMTSISSQAV